MIGVGLTTEQRNGLFVNRSLLSSLDFPTARASSETPFFSTRKAPSGSTCPRVERPEMGSPLFVGNFGYRLNESDLAAMFAEFGAVQSAKIVVTRDTNRSRGFGFVEMDNDAEAQAAIAALHGREYDGRAMTVKVGTPRESRGGDGHNQGGDGAATGGNGRGARY
jgi:cold-inducible RNA-binding protein